MGSNNHQRFQQPNSALLKFRSAPSSLLANFTDGIDSISSTKDQFEGSESERFVSRFMNSNDSESPTAAAGAVNRMNCQADYLVLPPHYPWPNSVMSSSSPSPSSSSSSMSNSYGLLGSNLAHQNSSPAGAFSQHGYGTIRSEGNYSRLSGNNNGEVSPPSNKLNSQISFSSILPSSLDMELSHISEGVSETIVGGSHINEKLGNSRGESLFLRQPSGFLFTSWNESPHFSEPFHGIKRDANIDRKLFSSHQNGEEIGNRVHMLSHHLSLPKNSSDIASIEKLLQLQDAVPCRIRAKRGCATHPRSIAERVRRTRISERMRKLQDLVPNMDKQTNTADMLDLAVEYIKDLQKQFKTLSDNRANCKCLSMQKPVSKPII